MLALAGSVDDAAHHRDIESFDAGAARLPLRHGFADETLDAGCELPERGRCRAATARAGGPERHERSHSKSLQQFLTDFDFESAIAVRLGRQRNADGIADALLKQIT